MSTSSSTTSRVTVLIRSMDRDHLPEALASVQAQRYPALNILVINAKGGQHRALPPLETPCRLIETGHPLGRAEAANVGLEAVDTPYAMFLDDDDLIDPAHVARLVHALEANPQTPAVYSGVRLEKSTGEEVSTMDAPWVPGELLVHNTLPIHAVLFRMAAVNTEPCRFDTRFSQLEDWDFWLQLARQGDFVHVPGASATYRLALGESGLSEQRDLETFKAARRAVWQKWLPQSDGALLQSGLTFLIDRLEQLEWDTRQLHASEAGLHQRDHERLGQLQELREHYEKLQALHAELHQAHGAAWEKLDALGGEHARTLERLQDLQRTLDEKDSVLSEKDAALSEQARALAVLEPAHRALEQQHAELAQQHAQATQRLHVLGEEMHALRHSRSMRLTRPLRWLTQQLRALRDGSLKASLARTEDELPIARARQKKPVGAIDLIVPVYKGLDETRDCLESIWAAPSKHAYRLIVINDSSPESALTEWLREAAKTRPMVLLENEENLGFVGTVNRGMAYSDSADVVLINSDAEVANDWLDRMVAAAYRPTTRPVASVTPFSNNATICSYPRFCEDNQLPDGFELATLDRLVAETNAGQAVEIPTGIGFCMYIRREALDDVGLFDVEHFGKGYGEENDFCMRTLKAGWCHLHALDVFAWHKGSVSFGDSQPERVTKALAVLHELHPDYESRVHRFIGEDPARQARLNIDVARLRLSPKPRVLMVNHQRGGGTERHCQELAETLKHEVEWLMLRPSPVGGARLSMLSEAESMALDYVLPEALDELVAMLEALGVVHVHFHHWLGFDQSILGLAKALGVTQDVTLHDYYAVCPQISLTPVDNRYCGEKGVEQCQRCLAQQPAPDGSSIVEWRERHASWLLASDRVISPSQDAATRFKRYIPALEIEVAVHPDQEKEVYPTPEWQGPQDGEPLRVAVIGALSIIKGADVLENVAALAAQRGLPIEFKLFGFAYRSLKTLPNLTVTGAYRDDELPTLLEEWQPHVTWFPPLWPETYSYTLSTCLALGLPVVASDLGALSERLHERPCSWLLAWDSSTEQWCDWFAAASVGADALNEPTETSRPWQHAPGDFYAQRYMEKVPSAPVAEQLAPLPSRWQAHAALADSPSMRLRKTMVSTLYWLRAQPLLRGLARHVPAGWQRRVKSRLLRES
ncbi:MULTISPECIES: glycosyltransferase [unclassified Halomonas]|uniref:glycosyltransferase n=1 Tax=unclassified Halomonas TaxID=2609666 RepID=UPI00209DB7C1|nr:MULTISPECIES: glycosyltransferase [unclassified Halomonas]MCP1314109.1 glycosyltransferase [Halomonas sp. 707D7]MCP1325140.1 glycosyltransferase [Halomonas sp. 707D4]